MTKKRKILLVDDDEDILEILQFNFENAGYEILTAKDGKDAVTIAKEFLPDVIIMDIMMPVMDGIEACRRIREFDPLKRAFIIFLTGRTEEYSEVASFQVGGNDYIIKPFKIRALMERIASYFNRMQIIAAKAKNQVSVKNLFIDKEKYTVLKDSKRINLARKEFELLYLLCENPNKVFSRETLLKEVWGAHDFTISRTVDVHIRKLRKKVGLGFISTVKGVGYKIEID